MTLANGAHLIHSGMSWHWHKAQLAAWKQRKQINADALGRNANVTSWTRSVHPRQAVPTLDRENES